MALECPHLSACPGCPRFGERELDPGVARRLATLARHFGAELCPPLHGGASGFRMRARLAVRGRRGRLKLGLFEEGTHVVADIPNCAVGKSIWGSLGPVRSRVMRIPPVSLS